MTSQRGDQPVCLLCTMIAYCVGNDQVQSTAILIVAQIGSGIILAIMILKAWPQMCTCESHEILEIHVPIFRIWLLKCEEL